MRNMPGSWLEEQGHSPRGITSASREVIRPVINKYKTLLFLRYAVRGQRLDRIIFIDGLTPARDTEVLVGHGMKNWARRFNAGRRL